MKNQIRSAWYLLVRNADAKGAVALVALGCAISLLALATNMVEGTPSDPGLLALKPLDVLPFAACLATVGVVTADTAQGAQRGSVMADGGRVGYVTSRIATVLAFTGLLWVLAAALAMLVVGVSFVLGAGSVAAGDWPQLAVYAGYKLLVTVAYVLMTLCLGWWQGTGGFVFSLLLAGFVSTGFVVYLPQMLVMLVLTAFWQDGAYAFFELIAQHGAPAGSSALVEAYYRMALPPVQIAFTVGVAAVCVAVSYAMWARRAA